jgi:hypothetical protein
LSTEVNSSVIGEAIALDSAFDHPGVHDDPASVHDLEHRNRNVPHRVSLVDDQPQRRSDGGVLGSSGGQLANRSANVARLPAG